MSGLTWSTSDRCRMDSERQQVNKKMVLHSQLTGSRWTDSVVTHLDPGGGITRKVESW